THATTGRENQPDEREAGRQEGFWRGNDGAKECVGHHRAARGSTQVREAWPENEGYGSDHGSGRNDDDEPDPTVRPSAQGRAARRPHAVGPAWAGRGPGRAVGDGQTGGRSRGHRSAYGPH